MAGGVANQQRNQDIALLLGGTLFGVGLGGWAKMALSPAFPLVIGLLLILGVVFQRIWADRPRSVSGGFGVTILDTVFSDTGVRFTAVLPKPAYGLWITCDISGIEVKKAILYQLRSNSLCPRFELVPPLHHERSALIVHPLPEGGEDRVRSETDITITALQPPKRLRVRKANLRKFKRMNARIKAAIPRLPRPPEEDPQSSRASA